MLEARHLVKRFFGVTVVNDVSFIVEARRNGRLSRSERIG